MFEEPDGRRQEVRAAVGAGNGHAHEWTDE